MMELCFAMGSRSRRPAETGCGRVGRDTGEKQPKPVRAGRRSSVGRD